MKSFLRGTALILAFSIPPIYASAVDNETFIGQTGDTNEITIEQIGQLNKVGADVEGRDVKQIGNDNMLTILQYGANNRVGAEAPFGSEGAIGASQTGYDNLVEISQQNYVATGKNIVMGITQVAETDIGQLTNSLSITQTSDSAAGGNVTGFQEGNHRVGEVTQIHDARTNDPNIIIIEQYDGADEDRSGNETDVIEQEGVGNQTSILQEGFGNKVIDALQYGLNNETKITQNLGSGDHSSGNYIATLRQDGVNNRNDITQSGNNNIIINVLQNNEAYGVKGNLLTITLIGDNNGGHGIAGADTFSSASTLDVEVGQATFQQFGDGNELSYTTSAGSFSNLFGFIQDGDDNFIVGNVSGTENEAAAALHGDDNSLHFEQNGTSNISAVTARGNNNHLNLRQLGINNFIDINFKANPYSGSNQNNDLLAAGFSLKIISVAGNLNPGDIIQDGEDNSTKVEIEGNLNLFAIAQTGDANILLGQIVGINNEFFARQNGSHNIAFFSQSGNNNSMILVQ